jgi:hypothetical protein
MRMKTEIKARWIKALKGNHYPQGRGCLVQKKGSSHLFDPLGVLCELYATEHNGIFSSSDELDYKFFLGEKDLLPNIVMQWAGLKESDPYIGNDSIGTLADAGITFNEIANLIKVHL